MKPRHHLYLDDELTTELELLAAKPGASKSSIVADALRQYVRHRGGNPHEAAIARRLDRLSQQNARLQNDMDILLETHSRFAWIYFLFTANLPFPDDTARIEAHRRYDEFMNGIAKALVGKGATASGAGDNVLTESRVGGDGQ